jgi:hypothetical protein
MVNGRLFDADAGIAEIGNRAVPAPQVYWQRHGGACVSFGLGYGPTTDCHCPKAGLGYAQ